MEEHHSQAPAQAAALLAQIAQAGEVSQRLEEGWTRELLPMVDYLRLHQGADEPGFRRNQPALQNQENTPKAGSVEVWLPVAALVKLVRHNWGNWCCQAAKESHTARSFG